jgi:hypothetical protein
MVGPSLFSCFFGCMRMSDDNVDTNNNNDDDLYIYDDMIIKQMKVNKNNGRRWLINTFDILKAAS